MNSFDLAVCAALAIAIGFGLRTGLLRGAMTILAYLLAAPIAVWLMPVIAPQLTQNPAATWQQNWLQNWMWFFAIFLVVGMALGHAGRLALADTAAAAGLTDRLGGAALGAIRVGLVATTLVLVFDQLVPGNRQPPFLVGSYLRPLFSAAGQMGFKSLPPEATDAIDRIKKERRI